MAGKSKRSKLLLTNVEVKELQQLAQSRTAPSREVQRAQIVCRYHSGETITEIARALRMTRKSVGKWIARGLALGVKAALKDTYHRPPARHHGGGEGLGGALGLLETQGAGLRGRTVDAQVPGPACASARGGGGTSVLDAGGQGYGTPHLGGPTLASGEGHLRPGAPRSALRGQKARGAAGGLRGGAAQCHAQPPGGWAPVVTVSVDEKPGRPAIANT